MQWRAATLGALLLLSGCVYYNALYNAERLLDQGEHARREGRDSLAVARYRDVVRKAAKGFRDDPSGPWAAQALLLLGKARLRLGEIEAAEAAFSRAETLATTPEDSLEARLYRGLALLDGGEVDEGTPLVSDALARLPKGRAAAEGHLRRGTILLEDGTVDTGWWDLEQAALMDSALRTSAALERARWAVHYDDSARVRTSFDRLLSYREAGAREDTVAALADAATAQWGPAVAQRLLGAVDTTVWASTPRGRIRLERARLMRSAGDTATAEEIAGHVAGSVGDAATEARVQLARWRLSAARNADEVHGVARLLVGSAENPQVVPLLTAVERFDRLAREGLDQPLAWFAAAEVAREDLGARRVARGLFLAYADAAPEDPWVPKALLAALAVTTDEGDRAWLRGRLEGRATSPYVLAARGEPAPGIEDLEEELARRLQEIDKR
jgi:tetratricopeptide (TPR) repeat protein